MPTRTARPTRPARTGSSRNSTTRRSTPRRSTGAQRRGVAGGWLQRRQPKPSRKSKATAAAKRALPGTKGLAAAGLALAGAVGVALRKRGGDQHESQATTTPVTPAVNSTPPVTSTPSANSTTPAGSPTTSTDVPPAA